MTGNYWTAPYSSGIMNMYSCNGLPPHKTDNESVKIVKERFMFVIYQCLCKVFSSAWSIFTHISLEKIISKLKLK